MIIFGFRTTVRRLATLMWVCRICGNPASQALLKRSTKFTLFFIPLFPVRVRHAVQCTFCGGSYDISRHEADRLAAQPGRLTV